MKNIFSRYKKSDIQIQKDAEAVDKGAGGDQTLSPGEKKRQTARIVQMEQLNMKVKTLKTMMTKAMKKLEKEISAFEKLESEQALITRVRRKAVEVTELREKLENEKKDMEKTSTILKEVMCECGKDKLGEDKDKAIDNLGMR